MDIISLAHTSIKEAAERGESNTPSLISAHIYTHSDQTEWWSSERFRVTDHGVEEFLKTRTTYKWIMLTPFPIFPSSVIRSLDDGRIYIELEYRDAAQSRRSTMVEAGSLSKLSSDDLEGYVVPDGRKRQRLGDALMQMLVERQNTGECVTREGAITGGWHKVENRFMHLRPGNDLFMGKVVPLTRTRGSADLWRETVTKMVLDSPLAALSLATALGSYMRGQLESDISHFLYLFGERGRGKSTILHMVASVQGCPEKGEGSPFFDGVSTLVGVENLLAASNHGFICLDELDDIFSTKGDGVERLMYFSNGGGRAKSDKTQAGGVSIGVTWNCTIIASGNTDIHDNLRSHRKAGPASQRVVQVDVEDQELHTFKNVNSVPSWTQTLQENFGWGYPMVVDILSEPKTLNEVRRAGNDYWDQLMEDGFNEDKQREAKFLRFAHCGSILVSQIFGTEPGEACQKAVEMLRTRISEKANKTEAQQQDADDFKRWIYDNVMRFRVKGKIFKGGPFNGESEQMQFATDCNQHAMERGNVLGLIVQPTVMKSETDFSGQIYLYASGREQAEKFGGIRMQEVINVAKREGWMRPGEGRNDAKKYNTASGIGKEIGQGRAYTFDFSAKHANNSASIGHADPDSDIPF